MDDLRARLEQALAGTHDLERELGGGGMSRTYLAVERTFRRRVVIKVLAPELIAGLSLERFHREILLAAQLQHPHMVPVLTAGEIDGLPWFTMPYVDGESLRKRLDDGPLPVSEAVSILRDVARALAYAHGQGVVHRDIKPDNVLLSAGTATVTDFGIAKALTAARTDSGAQGVTLTVAGTSLGTPAYMSPEQVTGDTESDHRADFYSFGAMAYELLAGRAPFQAPTASKVLAAHMTEAPADIRALRPDTPPQLAALVMSCLAKDPDDRPQHAADLVRVLDTVIASGHMPQVPAILIGGRVRLGRAVATWAAATATVALTAWAATDVIGLPDWVLPGSTGIMLAGLPVILMTAYIQRIAHRAQSAHGTLATLALKASPHVSWRRTWLGGTVAVVGFGVLVLGFMVTRALGIGPAASLRGSGAFSERETIVVADFRSPAGDSTLGTTVSEALRTDLAQSRALGVVTRAEMRELLALMQRPVESGVPFEVARELATREGAKAVLDGALVRIGQSYVVSARLVSAADGTELAAFREEADGEDELMAALGRLSRSVRQRAGESLRVIRASTDLERVTTPSLPALRRYAEASAILGAGGTSDRALELLREAVELDTAFAMAWRRLAVALDNAQRDRPAALAAISTAYRHRDRLTEMERALTEAYYYTRGPEPDRQRALAAYEAALRLDSTSTVALNNAAVLLRDIREYARAETLQRRALDVPRPFGGTYLNLAFTQVLLGRTAASDSTAALMRRRLPDSEDLWMIEAVAAWGRGDRTATADIAQAAARDGRSVSTRYSASALAGLVAEVEGRWTEGLAWASRASEGWADASPSAAMRYSHALDTAAYLAWGRGDPAGARAALARGFARYPVDSMAPSERPWGQLAGLAIATGDAALARRAARGYEEDLAGLTADPDGDRTAYAAFVALTERRWTDAVRLLHAADERFALVEREAQFYLGFAFDEAGQADSAIVYYDRYLQTPDYWPTVDALWRARVHRSLGGLYESRGDVERAAEQYERFLDLWQRADPELQPQVQKVRERLAELRRG